MKEAARAPMWLGQKPVTCEVCQQHIGPYFVDGKLKLGPWALMCVRCHKNLGLGLGTGLGQMYDTSTREKVGG